MFNDNWYLFLLIVMLAFFADGDINRTETAVMLAILLALTLTNGSETSNDSVSTNCFCDKSGL